MSRAAITYKTKNELREMTLEELNDYISIMKVRASCTNGYAKEKAITEVRIATKLKDLL